MRGRAAYFTLTAVATLVLLPVRLTAQEQTIAWNPVQSWTGRTDVTTERFFVAAAPWRVRWRLAAVPGFVPSLVVWVRKDGALIQDAVISHRGGGEGIADIELGPGSYELEIGSTNGDWTLTVEEFARVSAPDGPPARLAERAPQRPATPPVTGIATQACVGDPSPPGEGTFGGFVGIGDNALSYGATTTSNPSGPAGVGFSAVFVDFEDTDVSAYGFSGSVSLEATTYPVAICPVAGLGYLRIDDVDINTFTVPIGVGVGGAIEAANNLRIIPSVIPQVLIIHARGFGESVTETEFGVSFGVTFAGRSGFAAFDVGITTIDESDPSFGIAAGFIF